MLLLPGSLQRVPHRNGVPRGKGSELRDGTMANPTKTPPACKVVTQYHSGGEMVYELESPDACLEVRISSRVLGAGERSWHVAAQQRSVPDAAVISDEALTKSAALSKVAALWTEQAAELGLPTFDWTAVAAALLAVRGI